MHACRPMDSPLHLAYVATAPTPAANLFDLVVSASSIFGGLWEAGAGAIAAENEALAWLAGLAGFPPGAGGCFVSGGSAANLSALVTARHRARAGGAGAAGALALRDDRRDPRLGARGGPGDGRRRRGGGTRRTRPDDRRRAARGARARRHRRCLRGRRQPRHDQRRRRRRARRDRRRVRRATPLAAHRRGLRRRRAVRAIDRRRAAGVRAGRQLRRRSPQVAVRAVRLRGAGLPRAGAGVRRPRPARHVPRHGQPRGVEPERLRVPPVPSSPGSAAVVQPGDATAPTPTPRPSRARSTVARSFAAEVERRDGFSLLLQPQLSVVLFTVDGWTDARYAAWSTARAKEGVALVVPTLVAGRDLLPGLPRQPADDAGDALRPPRRMAGYEGA